MENTGTFWQISNNNTVQNAMQMVRNEVSKLIVGQDELLQLLVASICCGGHVLIEGVPGVAKTLSAKLIAKSMDIDFSRIQFTPDLMPSDVTGTIVFNMKESTFDFHKGPIFSNMVLIDEINRAPAKTQAALFEVMEEKQVSIDGTTYKMQEPFIVIATQNPIEQEGTYKLPEAQLDRFLFRIQLTYPSLEEEIQILNKFKDDFNKTQISNVKPILSAKQIQECRDFVEQITIQPELIQYIATIVHNTRFDANLYLGASPRASLAIMQSAKAIAAIQGRTFVTPDDIQYVAYYVLNHRLVLLPEREMQGITIKDVLKQIISKIEVPR